nr:MAG TPA: hypothetical protein [Caudoviricetes sp.]
MLSVIIRAKHCNKKGAELPTTNQISSTPSTTKGTGILYHSAFPLCTQKEGIFYGKFCERIYDQT